MKTVSYCSPMVPAEWIEAHGLRARWIVPPRGEASAAVRGMCPYAQAVVDMLTNAEDTTLAVLATTCDQMRRGAGMLAQQRPKDVFLLDVPATWQSRASREYYAGELKRLARWLVDRGGRRPPPERLAQVMIQYDKARDAFRRGRLPADSPCWCNPVAVELAREAKAAGPKGVALGIVGGPLLERDAAIVRWAAAAGGRIALDASGGGYRTLADRFDPAALVRDPFGELVRAYFDTIPAVFRRPNDRLHAWLVDAIRARGVKGLLCLRRVWCDLWHAELPRLQQTAGVPILDMDLGDEDQGGEGRIIARIEAMIESLGSR